MSNEQVLEKLIYQSMRLQTKIYELATHVVATSIAGNMLFASAEKMSEVQSFLHESKQYM